MHGTGNFRALSPAPVVAVEHSSACRTKATTPPAVRAKLANYQLIATVVASLTLACMTGCERQFSDPIVGSDDGPQDPCRQWGSSAACAADTANGCSFQPNEAGCLSTDPGCGAGVCRGGDPFVRRLGQTLWLHDSQFTFVGTVSWGIAWDPDGCRVSGFPDHEQALSSAFDQLAEMNISVLRFWAFQSFAGASGTDFANFERIVMHARRAGVRLIPVLENMHRDCSRGTRDDSWFEAGYRVPQDNPLSYLEYVRRIVSHFRNEPTILAWQLMHEARGSDFTALDTFVREVTREVRAVDQNHLLSIGADNGDSEATRIGGELSNYRRLHDKQEIDLIDVHDFDVPDEAFPETLMRTKEVADSLLKPIFVGASAVRLTGENSAAYALRASRVEAKIQAAFAKAFVGFLIYDYQPGWGPPGWSFDSRAEEPLAGTNGTIARNSRQNR